jgi:hypothetical protein
MQSEYEVSGGTHAVHAPLDPRTSVAVVFRLRPINDIRLRAIDDLQSTTEKG